MTGKTVLITRFPYFSSIGGEEAHTIKLAEFLRQEGYNVVFMGSCKVLLQELTKRGFEVKKVWGGKMIVTEWELLKSLFLWPFIVFNLVREFKKIAKKYSIKVLYCLSLNEKLFLSNFAKKSGCKIVWVEHQLIRNWLKLNFWRNRYKNNSNKVRIIPISQANKQALINRIGVTKNNIIEINNGVDITELNQIELKKEQSLVVSGGRFIKNKGFMTLLKGINNNRPMAKNFRFVITGQGPEEKKLKKYAEENLKDVNINFLPFLNRKDWLNLLAKAEIFVCCSIDQTETFSLVSAEAMALKCKLVVTNCTGVSDYLENKKEAVIVNPSANEIFEGIVIAKSLDQRLIEEAYKKVTMDFNLEKMLRSYLDLFQS